VTTTPEFNPADSPVIDDLSFADLLRIALGDAPGASQGRWTVHGPVDPGITIVELFAWQLEQRLFMAEQVTDPVIRASLRLLGAGEPASTQVASTVLCFLPAAEPVALPAGTLMNLDRDAASRSFTLDDAVTVLPIGGVAVTGRLGDDGDMLEFRLHHSGPRPRDETVSLLVDLDAAPGVSPSWSRTAIDVEPAAELVWTAIGPDDSEMPVSVTDQTGAFRRPGLIRLHWPIVWNALGAQPCRLRARATHASYTEPVPVRGVYANAVRASHREPEHRDVADQLGTLAPLPGQRLLLTGTEGALLAGPGEVSLHVTELDGEERVWTSVSDWSWVGPDDRVMVADRARGELVFGDGRAGRIMRVRSGSPGFGEFAVGGGEAGNVGPRGSWVRDGGDELAVNPLPAEGGHEAEALDTATQRAAGDLARADRLVTASDAEELVVATPGIGLQRAHATVGLHPDFPCVDVPTAVTVSVVPHAGRDGMPTGWTRAPRPDDGALSAAATQLKAARLIGQEVFVLPPGYRRVTVWATISQSPRNELLEARVTEALIRFLDPLRGGSDGRGWPFGGPVRPSALIGVVRSVLGPEADVSELSLALDDDEATDCADLLIESRELVWLGGAHITWVTGLPTGGGLT
jgi:hypothetical protein